MSAGRFKDINDCMTQLALKYPDPNMRKQVCTRLMQETATSGGPASAAKPKPKPPFGR